MSGNATADCDWLPPRGSHSDTSEAHGERRRPLDCGHIRLRGGRIRTLFSFLSFFFFFFSSASVREPSGDQLVTQRPWVSTREYGGWDRAGERGRDGDMPEMVKETQRRASSLMKCGNSFSPCCSAEAASCLKDRACSSF